MRKQSIYNRILAVISALLTGVVIMLQSELQGDDYLDCAAYRKGREAIQRAFRSLSVLNDEEGASGRFRDLVSGVSEEGCASCAYLDQFHRPDGVDRSSLARTMEASFGGAFFSGRCGRDFSSYAASLNADRSAAIARCDEGLRHQIFNES